MTFWSNFFSQGENKYETLKTKLTFHEQNSEENLHNSHPHLKDLFAKHQIDLKKIRKHGVRVAAAAAVLGAFLAIPHLIGHPSVSPPRQPPAAGKETGQLIPAQTTFGSSQGSRPTSSRCRWGFTPLDSDAAARRSAKITRSSRPHSRPQLSSTTKRAWIS